MTHSEDRQELLVAFLRKFPDIERQQISYIDGWNGAAPTDEEWRLAKNEFDRDKRLLATPKPNPKPMRPLPQPPRPLPPTPRRNYKRYPNLDTLLETMESLIDFITGLTALAIIGLSLISLLSMFDHESISVKGVTVDRLVVVCATVIGGIVEAVALSVWYMTYKIAFECARVLMDIEKNTRKIGAYDRGRKRD